MFPRRTPLPAAGPTYVDPSQPHDTCFKCGRPTPLGVSLCERDNPGHIKSPSATQVHGTIVIGIISGFVLLILAWRFTSGGLGPFASSLTGVATRADGGLEIVLSVTNNGTRPAGASCRVSPSGAPTDGDFVFFTEPIAPTETRTFTQTILPPPGVTALQSGSVLVRCT